MIIKFENLATLSLARSIHVSCFYITLGITKYFLEKCSDDSEVRLDPTPICGYRFVAYVAAAVAHNLSRGRFWSLVKYFRNFF